MKDKPHIVYIKGYRVLNEENPCETDHLSQSLLMGIRLRMRSSILPLHRKTTGLRSVGFPSMLNIYMHIETRSLGPGLMQLITKKHLRMLVDFLSH